MLLLSSRLLPRTCLRAPCRRSLSFSFAGPRNLDDIIKKDRVPEDMSGSDVSDMWFSYHDGKEGVIGLSLKGQDGQKIVERATGSPFFVNPVFRDAGFFNLVSQFQGPSHFLLALLDDYKMDPNACNPLLTFSVFNDYAKSKDVSLVRCDLLNKGLHLDEAQKVVQSLLDQYANDEDFKLIETFNHRPADFDFDDHMSRRNESWKNDTGTVNME